MGHPSIAVSLHPRDPGRPPAEEQFLLGAGVVIGTAKHPIPDAELGFTRKLDRRTGRR
jgi:hypothetical protein